jgi:chromosome segregation ATPase
MSKTTAPENASAQAAMLLDRLVSSSSAEDAAESLQGLLNGYSAESGEWEANWILNDDVLVEKMIELMHTGKINNIECDDSVASVIKLFQQLAKRGHTQQLLQAPIPGRLLESLLDVMGTSEQPVYIRVLSLQLLKSLSQHKSAQSQWLQAPNGLHRLGDLLEETEEVVRNEALLVAHDLSKHAPIAKVWIFAEVECKLLDACWTEGGLTRGNPIVLDALKLIHQLLQHADSALQDLVWQRPSLAPRLAQLLDLRGGTQFLNPETTQPTKSKNRKAQEDDDDDLDSLLQSGDVKNKNKLPETPPEPVVPQLTDKEEEIVHQVLEILRLLVQSEPVRHSVWKRHAPLVSLVWELALVNPANPPVCAMPSASLQQAALELVSQYFNHPETMDRHAGLDRLLFLVCTGGGTADNYAQQLGISQAALHVLRTTLTGDSIHQVLLHTLAPPPQEDENAPPPGPTVVEKLWNTVAENLAPPAADSGVDVDKDKRKIFLSGALGGLAMLLPDSTSREMMFKVTPPQADLDHMLQTLHEETDTDIRWTLLRFLCEWMDETPLIVQALLSSNESSHLATLAVDPKASSFTHLLLGLAMEHMGDEESLCGGWTRAGILLILQQVGISKYTKSLEGLKKQKEFPWAACDLEFQYWTTWCTKAVWTVRKRVVKELTGGNSAGDNSDEEHTDETVGESSAAPPSSGSLKPLQKLIAQQAKELDDLKKDLAKAQSKVTSQEQQLDTWKRRMESNPTELDSMLNDFTSKNASLEENIQVLEKELVQAKAQHEGELSQKDQVIAEQRQEVEHARTEEREAREDRDRMEQELQGVSQAYASLEEDYQRQQQPSHQATAGMPTGEPAQNQPEGEVSQQAPPSSTGSTEVSTLRAENNRLRTDARAADEWMSMAVQRMNDMGAQNGALQQQVASLQQQLQTVSTSAGGATAELQQQLQAASQHQEQLIEQLQTAAEQEEELRVALANQATQLQQEQSTIEQMHVDLTNQAAHLQQEKTMRESAEEQLGNADRELQQQLEEEREQRRHLQGQLASSQEDVRVAMESLGKAKDGREQMERQMANLSEELDRVRQGGPTSDASSELSERLAQLQAQYDTMLTSKQGELRALAEQLEQARLATAVPPAESTPESSERFIQLRADYDSMVASKEAEIQALCEQLEQARLAAPTQATAEVASLPVLEAQPTSDDHLKANIESVTQQLDAVHKELGRSHETLYQKESIIRELEERLNGGLGAYKLDDIRIRDEEISELRAANETAQDWMAKAVEHHALLSTKIASLSEQKASLTAQLNQVKGLVSPSDANAAVVKLLEHELSEKSNEIDQLRAELGQRQEEITAVREEINAKQATKYELEIARDEIASLRQQREQAYESKEELESRVDASATEISSLKEEIDRLGSQVTSDVPRPLPGGVTAPHIDAQALRSENERLKDSTLDLQKRLDEFQDWADMAQGRIAEILARKEHAEKLMQQANEALDRGQQESENLKTELADMTALVDDEKEANMALLNQRDVMIDKIEEFEAEKSSWQSGPSDTPEVEKSSGVSESSKDRHEKNISELERANEALAIELENHKTEMQDLKGKYDGMQTRFESGLQRIAEVVAEKKQLETNLSQEKDSINVARKELDLLRSELEVMTADLAVETEKRSLLLKERDDLMTKIEEAQESECNPVEIAESTVAQRIADLEELLRKKDVVIQDAQETLVKDGEVVDQWEGKFRLLVVFSFRSR